MLALLILLWLGAALHARIEAHSLPQLSWINALMGFALLLMAACLLAIPSYTLEVTGPRQLRLTIHTLVGSSQVERQVSTEDLSQWLRIEPRRRDECDGFALVLDLGQGSLDFEFFGQRESAQLLRAEIIRALDIAELMPGESADPD